MRKVNRVSPEINFNLYKFCAQISSCDENANILIGKQALKHLVRISSMNVEAQDGL